MLTASQPNLGAINFNNAIYFLKVTGGGAYTVADGTYKIVNRNSGKVGRVGCVHGGRGERCPRRV